MLAAIVVPIVLAFLGEGLIQLTARMTAVKDRIRHWAIGLGICTGVFAWFAILPPSKVREADGIVDGVLGAALVGFLGGLFWYCVVALITFTYQLTLGVPLRFLGDWRRRRREQKERRREEKRRRQQERDYQRGAPARARLVVEQASSQKRREDARAACDVRFALVGPEIRERFSKEMFDDFTRRHLGDDRSPEYVEQRSRELCDVLQKHLEKTTVSPQDVKEIAAARQEVQAFYDQHADLLREVCPPIRLKAELHARIPDTVTPEIAWKEASSLIADLLQLIAEERRKQASRLGPTRPINPPPLKNI